ncbi:MAG: DUF3089 domain-containing protein [Bacillota bacterium]
MKQQKKILFDSKNRKIMAMILSMFLMCALVACGEKDVAETEPTEATTEAVAESETPEVYTISKTYISQSNWAYYGEESVDLTLADCFFLAPTVYSTDEEIYNLSLDNGGVKSDFLGASNMERGIYDGICRMYAPYYAQVALEVYEMDIDEREQYLEIAYADVREAFLHYIHEENNGRPFVLAGFSQGADMALRLMKEFFDEPEYQEKLVACYAIGWGITEEELQQYPHLKMAETDNDLGGIVTFNTEMEGIATSLMVPEKTLAINPLTWTTTSKYASSAYNLGACFTNYDGEIVDEIPNLTGAYLDEERGTLIVDDTITPAEFPPGISIFDEGVYHLYDYMFFYRNLQENVQLRVVTYSVRDGSQPVILEEVETEAEEVEAEAEEVEAEEVEADAEEVEEVEAEAEEVESYADEVEAEAEEVVAEAEASTNTSDYPEPVVLVEGVPDTVAYEINTLVEEGVPPLMQIIIYDPVVDEPKFDGLAELTENEIYLSSEVPYELYGNASFGYAIEFAPTESPLGVVVSFVEE